MKRLIILAIAILVGGLVWLKSRTASLTAPKTMREHFGDIKETLGFDYARDMDSPEIIAERRKDLGVD